MANRYEVPANELEALNALIDEIREDLRDHAELKHLVEGTEHSNKDIARAIIDALREFNSSPPYVNYSIDNFPDKELLKLGAIYRLIRQLGVLTASNSMSFSDGGVSVSFEGKSPLFAQWFQFYYNEFKQRMKELKVQLNIRRQLTGGSSAPSPYAWLDTIVYYVED